MYHRSIKVITITGLIILGIVLDLGGKDMMMMHKKNTSF